MYQTGLNAQNLTLFCKQNENKEYFLLSAIFPSINLFSLSRKLQMNLNHLRYAVILLTIAHSLDPTILNSPVTPNSLVAQHPEFKPRFRPERLTYRYMQLPNDLNRRLQLFTMTVVNRKLCQKCYDQCFYPEQLKKQVQNYIFQRPQINNLYLQFHPSDDLVVLNIRRYLWDRGVKQPQFSHLFDEYVSIVRDTPSIIMWQERANPLHRFKITFPDAETMFNENYEKTRREAADASNRYPWDKKESKVGWRDAGYPRYDIEHPFDNLTDKFPRAELVRISKEHPQSIDAKFTKIQENMQKKLKDLGLDIKDTELSHQEQLKYKYVMSVDSFAPSWLLKANSVLLKSDSTIVMWYYADLKPKKHYYPIKNDLSDLVEAYNYLEAHQDQAKAIVNEANKFASEFMTKDASIKAFRSIMDQYVKMQNSSYSVFQPVLPPGVSFEDIHDRLNSTQKLLLFDNPKCPPVDFLAPVENSKQAQYIGISKTFIAVELLYVILRVLFKLVLYIKKKVYVDKGKDDDIIEEKVPAGAAGKE